MVNKDEYIDIDIDIDIDISAVMLSCPGALPYGSYDFLLLKIIHVLLLNLSAPNQVLKICLF